VTTSARRGAVFVLAGPAVGQLGPVASWLSTAGWAAAARRVLGEAIIVTPSGVVDLDEARYRGSDPRLGSASASSWRRRVPTPIKTGLKDARQWQRSGRFRIDPAQHRDLDLDLAFVWQRHELFQTAGIELARALGKPSVLFVPATHVWEAERWGVRRPGWSGLVERAGESPALSRADVVCCGTELVAEQACRLGTEPDRILITPTGVDLESFADLSNGRPRRAALGLDGRFVVGWVGSFRGFHAVEQAVAAVADIEDASLLLVGDGPERPRIEAIARAAGVHAVFTGTVPHRELPALLGAMDVALVLAGRDEVFHYSPLKLAEYLAAGRPVVVPDVPQLAARLVDGVDAVLVPPGDEPALAQALRRLRDDPATRARLGAAARAAAEAHWSWDHAIRQILARLAARSGRQGP
jgi:glycosyltransferase involved in cell wall biosynthesis